MLTARPRFSKRSLGTVGRPWWDTDPDQLSLSVNKPDQTHNNHYSHDTLISPPANEHLRDCGLSYVRQPCGTAECQELRRCFFLEILIPVCVLQSSSVLFPKKLLHFCVFVIDCKVTWHFLLSAVHKYHRPTQACFLFRQRSKFTVV